MNTHLSPQMVVTTSIDRLRGKIKFVLVYVLRTIEYLHIRSIDMFSLTGNQVARRVGCKKLGALLILCIIKKVVTLHQ